MRMKWAALLMTMGLGAGAALAGGFGFSISSATVNNNDSNGNGIADVGETLTVTGAPFASYRSSGSAPVIADNDLNRYSANIAATATEVVGTKVRYQGTFELIYNGPQFSNVKVEAGTLDVRAEYDASGTAILDGTFMANPGAETNTAPWNTTDFSPYNTGRWFGVYIRNAADHSKGLLGCSMNAGQVGFAASMNNALLTNADENNNGVADVGETFSMDATVASYYTVGGPPLNNNDIDLYHFIVAPGQGKVISVTGTTATYEGPFTIRYINPALSYDQAIESGTFRFTASFYGDVGGDAKLTGLMLASPGILNTTPPWENTDFSIFNPGTFNGTYHTQGKTALVSGTLIGGVLGFSTSSGAGSVINNDTNGNGVADVGETYRAILPLSSYFSAGAPPLLDKDLNKYSLSMDGTATTVVGTTVTYTGTWKLTYTDNLASPPISIDVETGTFTNTAVYDGTTGAAEVTAELNAKPGVESNIPPFDITDYAPFNPGTFKGHYAPNAGGATGSLRGGLTAGTVARQITSRRFANGVEGSPTAAVQTDDARRAIIGSGTKLYVVDPATGNDAPGWEGGKTIDGKVFGRASVYKDTCYVGTDAGTLYAFDLKTGALLGSGKPAGAGSKILTAPAVVPAALVGEASDSIIVSATSGAGAVVVKVLPTNLGVAVATQPIGGAQSVSSPSIPNASLVFVGSDASLVALRTSDLAIQQTANLVTPTSPIGVGGKVFVGVNAGGSTFATLNGATGLQENAFALSSNLILGAFYEKKVNLVHAGTQDGRIQSFNPDGTFAGYTLSGLFNFANTNGSRSMPVVSNSIIYRSTENKQILSGWPLYGDSQETIDTVTSVRQSLAATGQTVGSDWIIGVAPDGNAQFIAVR
jgi:hypothetical protein